MGRQADGYRAIAGGMAVSPSGRIAVGAACVRLADFADSPCIEVFDTNGVPDVSTNGSGYIAPNFSVTSGLRNAAAVLFDLNEQIIAVGSCDSPKFCIRRFLRSGAPDLQFGSGGLAELSIRGYSDTPQKAVMQGDDKILIGGICQTSANWSYSGLFCLARLDRDGLLDTTFGSAGVVLVLASGAEDTRFGGLSVLPSGRIVVTGACSFSLSANFYPCAVRLESDGSTDDSFGLGGVARVLDRCATGLGFNAAEHVTASDGTITLVTPCLATGGNVVIGLLRFTPEGEVDARFGNGGFVELVTPTSLSNEARAVYLQPDGKVLVAGQCYPPTGVSFCVARVIPDGSPDNTFGNAGIAYLAPPTALPQQHGPCGLATAMTFAHNGRILLSGRCNQRGDYERIGLAGLLNDPPARLCALNVDDDLTISPSTDAVLLIRYLLGFRGAALTVGALGANSLRTGLDLESYLASLDLDADGDGQVVATTDGVLILRAMLGLTGAALTSGASNATNPNVRDAQHLRAWLARTHGMTCLR